MIEISTLPSGLRIVTDTFDSPLAAVSVTVETGTRWEPVHLNGLAHFLEHMAFKGTTSRSAYEITHEIESRGGYMNAGTGKDVTQYYAVVMKEDAAVALDVLADIVCNSTLPEDEFELERGVIQQEMRDLEDDPMAWLGDRMMEVGFTGGLSLPGLGRPETLAAITVDDLGEFVSSQSATETVIISASGGVTHEAVVRTTERCFAGLRDNTHPVDMVPSQYFGGYFAQPKKSDTVHLIVAFPSFKLGHPDLYPDSLFAKMVGGCNMSRLWQEIREKRGLCYTVHSSAQAWREAGLCGVSMSCGAEQAVEAVKVLCNELKRSRDGLTDSELAIGKKLAKAEVVMAQETVSDRVGAICHHLAIHGKPYDLAEELEKFEAVTHADIRRVIEVQGSAPPTIAIRGPKRVVEKLDILKWLR